MSREELISCPDCKKPIYFRLKRRGPETGKLIRVDPETFTRHACDSPRLRKTTKKPGRWNRCPSCDQWTKIFQPPGIPSQRRFNRDGSEHQCVARSSHS